MPHTLKPKIRTIPHWPKQGVMFRDITTLLKDAEGFKHMIDLFVERYKDNKPDIVAGIEARGLIIGSALAHRLGLGFVPIRKPNKLPAEKESVEYETEYSTDKIEVHKDAISPGMNVLIADDLIATGGSMLAACKLIEKLGGRVMECAVVIDLPDLNGSEKIKDAGYKIFKLIDFEGE